MQLLQLDAIRQADADLWVLTECPQSVVVGSSSESSASYRDEAWSWVSIQGTDVTRVEIEFTADLGCAALVIVRGQRVAVVASVLPWKGAHTLFDIKANAGAEVSYRSFFDDVLVEHLEALRTLHAAYPDLPLIWAGDFNQELDNRRCYVGADAGRKAIFEALAATDLSLRPHTKDELALDEVGATIDHICGPAAWDADVERIARTDLSDHAGYVAAFSTR